MSLSVLLQATRDRIRTALELTSAQCCIMPDDRAIPMAGQEFISVFGSSWSPMDQDLDMGIDETYGVTCAVTRRVRYSPSDRAGENIYVEVADSMEKRIRQLIKLIHKNYDILTEANTILALKDENVSGIVEPLRWKSSDSSPRFVGPEHFYLPGDQDQNTAAFVMSVSFGDARRVQRWDSFDLGE